MAFIRGSADSVLNRHKLGGTSFKVKQIIERKNIMFIKAPASLVY